MKNIQPYDQFITEGVSNLVYHFTGLHGTIGVLKDNRMIASAAMANGADGATDYGHEEAEEAKLKRRKAKEVKAMNWHLDAGLPEIELTRDDEYTKYDYQNRGKHFYISFQRTRDTKQGYARNLNKDVCINFDGRKLNTRYKGTAIDYWRRNKNLSFWKKPADLNYSNEMEDRLTLDSPYLDNVRSYILEIHLMVWTGGVFRKDYETLEALCKEKQIPVFFYDNQKYYGIQDKKGAKPLSDIPFDDPKYQPSDDYNTSTENYASRSLSRIAPFFIYKNPANRDLIERTFGLDKFPNLFYYENNYNTYALNNRFPGKEDIERLQREFYEDVAQIRTAQNPYLIEMNRLLSKEMRKYNSKTTYEYVNNKLAAIKEQEKKDLITKQNSIMYVFSEGYGDDNVTNDKVDLQLYEPDLREPWMKIFRDKHKDRYEAFAEKWDDMTMGDLLELCKSCFRKETNLRRFFKDFGFELRTFKDVDKRKNPWDYRD